MEDLATRALTDLVNVLETGMDTVPAYVQDLIHRYAMYGIYSNSIWVLITLPITILCIIFLFKDDDWWCWDWGLVAAWITLGIPALVFLIVCITDIIKAICVPDIYLINALR